MVANPVIVLTSLLIGGFGLAILVLSLRWLRRATDQRKVRALALAVPHDIRYFLSARLRDAGILTHLHRVSNAPETVAGGILGSRGENP